MGPLNLCLTVAPFGMPLGGPFLDVTVHLSPAGISCTGIHHL